jgi:hypothetical protein
MCSLRFHPARGSLAHYSFTEGDFSIGRSGAHTRWRRRQLFPNSGPGLPGNPVLFGVRKDRIPGLVLGSRFRGSRGRNGCRRLTARVLVGEPDVSRPEIVARRAASQTHDGKGVDSRPPGFSRFSLRRPQYGSLRSRDCARAQHAD